jgi:hypothetical protein
VKELFRCHEHVLKSHRPSLITDSLSNVTQIPINVVISIIKQPVNGFRDELDEFFDAPDHFSDFESDFDEQAPEDDVSGMIIKFLPFTVWNNSEHNEVEYILPANFGNKHPLLI